MQLFYTFILLAIFFRVDAQDIQICNWQDDKKSAVVLTFDDWLPGHEKIVVPLLIKRQIPATFFVTTQAATWNKNAFKTMRLAQANGSEIANHTLTHPDLTAIDFKLAKKEINDARKLIMDSVPGAECLTFAYPMGTKNPELITEISKTHIAARAVSQFSESGINYNFAPSPIDYYKINTVRVWRIVTSQKIASWLDYSISGGGMVTFMMHSIYNDTIAQGWDAIHESFLSEILDTLQAKEKQIWVTTFANAVKYHQEKSASKIEVISNTSSALEFKLTCPLDSKIYNQPLTLKLEKTAKISKITQNGKSIPFKVTADGKWILFDVVPSQKTVLANH